LWRAVERTRRMQIGIMVELDEGLQRDVEPPAVVEQRAMVIGNSPWTRIDIEPLLEFAFLLESAELDKTVAAADRPVAAAGAVVEFEDLNLVAGLAQFQRRHHAGEPGTQDQDRRPLRITRELDRALVGGFGREAETRHRVIHRRTAGDGADQREQVT